MAAWFFAKPGIDILGLVKYATEELRSVLQTCSRILLHPVICQSATPETGGSINGARFTVQS